MLTGTRKNSPYKPTAPSRVFVLSRRTHGLALRARVSVTSKLALTSLLLLFAPLIAGTSVLGQVMPPEKVLFDFEGDFDLDSVETRGVELELAGPKSNRRLQFDTDTSTDWPGITLKPTGEFWDGTPYQNVSLDITNLNDDAFELGLRIDNVDGDAGNNFTVMTQVEPGESRKISATLYNTSALCHLGIRVALVLRYNNFVDFSWSNRDAVQRG